jgi:hypothetical protein
MSWLLAVALGAGAVAAGCGSSPKHTASPIRARSSTTTATGTGPGALQAEANSAAAGDIPDNQVFLVFRDRAAAYSIKYPEGWARRGSGANVVFRDKNNIARIAVGRTERSTPAAVARELARLHGVRVDSAPRRVTLAGRPAVKVVYSTVSAPNAVTGKRVTLVVDRYYVPGKGRRAVVDLGTPQGVDNVDAYRLMIESFRWR